MLCKDHRQRIIVAHNANTLEKDSGHINHQNGLHSQVHAYRHSNSSIKVDNENEHTNICMHM